MTDTFRSFGRRRLLSTTAGGVSALALSHGLFGADALAVGPKKKKKSPKLTQKQIAELEAKHPEGSVKAAEAKLSGPAKRLGKLLLQKSRHAVALAAANPKAKFQPGSIHSAAAAKFAKLSPARSRRAKARASKLLAASDSTRVSNFGPYAKAQLSSATVKQATDIQLVSVIKDLSWAIEADKKRGEAKKADEKADPIYKRLEFQLNSVKCVDATSGEWYSDELLLGGHLIERDGNIVEIGQFMVGDDFDDGEKKYYDYETCGTVALPPDDFIRDFLCPHGGPDDIYRGRKLAGSKLGGPGTWGLIVVLGEQDEGGFGDVLSDLYSELEDEIQSALDAAGEAVGKFLSQYVGPLGELIGQALAWALGKLIEWFVSLFDNQDDLIAAKSWMLTLEKRKQAYVKELWSDHLPSPKGTWTSPMKKLEMYGDGAHYDVRLHCRVFAS